MDMRADEQELHDSMQPNASLLQCYFGRLTRGLFIFVCVCTLIILPFFQEQIPIVVTAMLVIGVGIGACLTRPEWWSIVMNVVIAGIALFIIESSALLEYRSRDTSASYLIITQLISLFLIFALYYSIKTLRNFLLKKF